MFYSVHVDHGDGDTSVIGSSNLDDLDRAILKFQSYGCRIHTFTASDSSQEA